MVAQAITSISVYSEGRMFTWLDLCVKFEGQCVDNTFLDLLKSGGSNNMENLSYPVMQDQEKEVFYPLFAHLGGVEVNTESKVVEAGALRLSFMLDDSNNPTRKASLKWINAVHHFTQTKES